jgi:hypothetical protein
MLPNTVMALDDKANNHFKNILFADIHHETDG